MSRREIAGSRALVTGASSGIGREIALVLARQEADLVVVARREQRLRELAETVGKLGRRIECVVGDVTEASIREAALRCAQERLGGLDILVNNAGVGALGPFAEADPARLRRVMEVNFFALAEMTRSAIPLLKAGRQPLVVNIGSIAGHHAQGRASEYGASKFAVRGLSQSLRAELKPLGIGVLLVSPGGTETEIFDHLLDSQTKPAFRAKRLASADAIARRTVRAMRSGRREVFPDLQSRLIDWVNRFTPSLLDWVVERRG